MGQMSGQALRILSRHFRRSAPDLPALTVCEVADLVAGRKDPVRRPKFFVFNSNNQLTTPGPREASQVRTRH